MRPKATIDDKSLNQNVPERGKTTQEKVKPSKMR